MIFSLIKFVEWTQKNNYSYYDTSNAYTWANEFDGKTKEEIKETNPSVVMLDEWFEEF